MLHAVHSSREGTPTSERKLRESGGRSEECSLRLTGVTQIPLWSLAFAGHLITARHGSSAAGGQLLLRDWARVGCCSRTLNHRKPRSRRTTGLETGKHEEDDNKGWWIVQQLHRKDCSRRVFAFFVRWMRTWKLPVTSPNASASKKSSWRQRNRSIPL